MGGVVLTVQYQFPLGVILVKPRSLLNGGIVNGVPFA
jgi:hypothetical protein